MIMFFDYIVYNMYVYIYDTPMIVFMIISMIMLIMVLSVCTSIIHLKKYPENV